VPARKVCSGIGGLIKTFLPAKLRRPIVFLLSFNLLTYSSLANFPINQLTIFPIN